MSKPDFVTINGYRYAYRDSPARVDSDMIHWKGVNWQRGYARKTATCVISGEEIQSGDRQYRPIWGAKSLREERVAADTWD